MWRDIKVWLAVRAVSQWMAEWDILAKEPEAWYQGRRHSANQNELVAAVLKLGLFRFFLPLFLRKDVYGAVEKSKREIIRGAPEYEINVLLERGISDGFLKRGDGPNRVAITLQGDSFMGYLNLFEFLLKKYKRVWSFLLLPLASIFLRFVKIGN